MTGVADAWRQYEIWRYRNKNSWDWKTYRKKGVFFALYQSGPYQFYGSDWHSISAVQEEVRYFLSHNNWRLVKVGFATVR